MTYGKRLTALMLAVLISLGVMSSCGESAEAPASTTADETGFAAAEETTVDPEITIIPDELPDDLDFGGADFRIGFMDEGGISPCLVFEANGDVVNDAVYESTTRVMERLNVNFVPVIYGDAGMSPVRKSVMSGDNAYEAVTGHDISIGNLSITGIFLDNRAVPYLDFDKPWWPSYSVDSLTVNGHMMILTGYLSYHNLQSTQALWLNKKILENFGHELPYQSVRDGLWTLDRLTDLVKDVYTDLNGDTVRDDGDLYGWANTSAVYGYQESFGIEPYKEDENGVLYVDASNERLLELVNKTRNIFYGTDGGMILEKMDYIQKFREGTSMMMYAGLGTFASLRDSDIEYGFLPTPKFDELQEYYMSGSTDRPYAIPANVPDAGYSGAVLEALASEGYRTVRPAYFDIALKNKYTYDEDSAEMLDIIGNTIILDFAYIYSNYVGFAWTLMTLLGRKSKGDFASYAAKQESKENKRIDKLNEFFQSIG